MPPVRSVTNYHYYFRSLSAKTPSGYYYLSQPVCKDPRWVHSFKGPCPRRS